MKNENTEKIRERILALIDSEFESDVAFEREMKLGEKTVNNWRRGRSSSFLNMLPDISERFGVNIGELLDLPLRGDTSELSENEIELLSLYRKAGALPQKVRAALKANLEATINLYISAVGEMKASKNTRKNNKKVSIDKIRE